MAANQQILKEYLLSLGFKIDSTSAGKFDFALGKFDLSVGGLAKKVVGVATATQGLVAVFARSMEQLYYASKRTEATAGNIAALDFAGKNVGVDNMRASLEAMARALRSNPGLTGLLHDLGIKVEGRDRSDVMIDMVKALKGMPFYVAQQYAGLFGIDGDTLLMLQQGVEELEKAATARKKMAADVGVDTDVAAKAGKEYMNQLREIWEMLGLLKDALAIALLEPMKNVAAFTKEVLKDWIQIIKAWNGVPDFFKKLKEGVTGKVEGPRVTLSPEAQRRINAGELGSAPPAAAPKASDPSASLFERLESQYGLPKGLLDRMWAKESARGTRMTSRVGAQGHFQFMPNTAKDVGLKDPNNLAESAEKASQYLAMLMNRYGGDIQKTLAAYNWGMGNVDKKGLANAPWETRDYVQTLSGRPITVYQTTTIQVSSNDPQAAARAVGREQDRVNANIVRNQAGAIDNP